MTRISTIVLICILLLAPSAFCANVHDQLQGINKEIKEKKRLIKKSDREEKKVSGELIQIEKSLKEKEDNLSSLHNDLRRVEGGLSRTRLEIEVAEKDAERKRAEIRRRLAAGYKGGEVGTLRIFFSSESFPQMTENMRYMRAVVQTDKRLVEEYNGKIERLKGLKVSLEHDAARKERIKGDIELKKQAVEAEKKKKAEYLGKVKQDKKSYLSSLRELEANARRLQTMVERLEASRRKSYTPRGEKHVPRGDSGPPVPDKGFGSLKGRLSLPVKGEITERFGRHKHPEFNSYTISNGVTIAAPAGADIHALYEGRVIFAEYFKGYGNMVIIDHGGGFFSLYAHASRIARKTGSTVARNEVIASVGDVDSTKGPGLYMEIRYQGKPVDPAPWFR